MNDGELRILEYVKGQLDGVREDLRDMRTEVLAMFMRHDESDNNRFAELFTRIRPLETARAVQEHQNDEDRTDDTRWHNWQIVLVTVLGTILAGVIGAALTAHLTPPPH